MSWRLSSSYYFLLFARSNSDCSRSHSKSIEALRRSFSFSSRAELAASISFLRTECSLRTAISSSQWRLASSFLSFSCLARSSSILAYSFWAFSSDSRCNSASYFSNRSSCSFKLALWETCKSSRALWCSLCCPISWRLASSAWRIPASWASFSESLNSETSL